MVFMVYLGVHAQVNDSVRYSLPDGKVVTYDKLDSVKKAWGDRGFLMRHNDQQPKLIFISPMTDAYLKHMQEQKDELSKLLNKQGPEFNLTDLTGKHWKLSALKGKIVVLNFWFTNCPGCIQEMPQLNELKDSFTNKEVLFLALSLDGSPAVKHFLTIHPFNYTLLTDAEIVSKLYNVSAYPTSVIIDAHGIIRFQQVGGENIKEEISKVIYGLLQNNG